MGLACFIVPWVLLVVHSQEDLEHAQELADNGEWSSHLVSNHLHDKLLLFELLSHLMGLVIDEPLSQLDKMSRKAFVIDGLSLHLQEE